MYNAWGSTAGNPDSLIIDRYISWEILRPFCGGLGLLILVFVGYSAARQLNLAAEGQMTLQTALALIGLNTLITLEVLLPSALFFSILAALGRMHRDGEMYILHAAGVSPLRILESVLKLALVIALITGFVSISGRPWAFRESYRLEAESAAQFDLRKMASGRFVNLESSDYTFIADGLDLDRGLHKGVFLQRNYEGRKQRSEIIVAESAALPQLNPGQVLTAQFFNGYYYLLDNRGQMDITMRFKEFTVKLPYEEAQANYRRKAETTTNLADSREPKEIAEFQWRLSTPVATLMLALLAVPLSKSRPRESRFRIFLVAVAVYVGVFSLTAVARTWIEQEKLAPLPGLWGVYVLLGLVLLVLLKPPPRLRWS